VVKQAKSDSIAKSVRLYVDQENKKAMDVYERLGMTKHDESVFMEVDFVLGLHHHS